MTRTLSLSILLTSLVAFADDAPAPVAAPPEAVSLTPAQIREAMHTWTGGERASVIPFGFTGVTTVVAGSWMVAQGDQNHLAWGAGWPLLSIGALEIIAGAIFSIGSFPARARFDAALDKDPAEFARVERAHLHRIRDRFQPLLLGLEAAITIAGGVMAGVGAGRHDDTLAGVGLGLAVQGLALFLLDWAVLDRANAYTRMLDLFLPGA